MWNKYVFVLHFGFGDETLDVFLHYTSYSCRSEVSCQWEALKHTWTISQQRLLHNQSELSPNRKWSGAWWRGTWRPWYAAPRRTRGWRRRTLRWVQLLSRQRPEVVENKWKKTKEQKWEYVLFRLSHNNNQFNINLSVVSQWVMLLVCRNISCTPSVYCVCVAVNSAGLIDTKRQSRACEDLLKD